MPESTAELRKQLEDQRKRRVKVKVRIRRHQKTLHVLSARIERTRQRIQARKNPGAKAAAALLSHVGKQETGYNDAPWLRKWEDRIVKAGIPLGWMIPGNPYCGMGCVWAWLAGTGKKLPADTVSTLQIVARANRGESFHRVSAEHARSGDLVVFDFDGGGADHVGLALGAAKGGVIQTVEANTSPGAGGSQQNGDGVWKRSRPTSAIACVARPK